MVLEGAHRGWRCPGLQRWRPGSLRVSRAGPWWGGGCGCVGAGEPWGSCMIGEQRVREGMRRGFAAGDAS